MSGAPETEFMKKELGIFILLIVLCIIVSAINPNFLLAINLQNLARQIGAFGIFSIGLGLVIITGGIELSVGSMMGLCAVVFGALVMDWHWPLAAAALAALIQDVHLQVRNRHPDGGATALGISPCSAEPVARRSGSGWGIAASSAFVYG